MRVQGSQTLGSRRVSQAAGEFPEELADTWGFDDGDACGRCMNNIDRISQMVELKLVGLLVKAV